ncbi:MAG: UDP-3-O-(3-hydroxymyristoyl)glucosamine N-acyltransferase [Planctomycetaceae bacterium]
MQRMTVADLAKLVAGDVHGDRNAEVSDGQSVDKAGPEHVTFVESERILRQMRDCKAGCVVLSPQLAVTRTDDWAPAAYIVVDDPLTAFSQILAHLRPARPRADVGVSPQAHVSPSAVIGRNTNIHPGAVIGDDCVIGDGCEILFGAVLGPGCAIGDDVVLHPHVVLYHDVLIGNRVTIHSSAVIGSDGFGYRVKDGRRQRVPHFGTVRIEDDVEIGACTTVDRAMIGETIVGEGTKLDNLVMIAHNCELGKHNALVGQVGLAGSVTTGDSVVCAGQVGVADHVHIGTGAVIGSKAGIHKDVPAGETYLGIPAGPMAEAIRVFMATRRLPQALKTIRKLQSQIDSLKSDLAAVPEREAA